MLQFVRIIFLFLGLHLVNVWGQTYVITNDSSFKLSFILKLTDRQFSNKILFHSELNLPPKSAKKMYLPTSSSSLAAEISQVVAVDTFTSSTYETELVGPIFGEGGQKFFWKKSPYISMDAYTNIDYPVTLECIDQNMQTIAKATELKSWPSKISEIIANYIEAPILVTVSEKFRLK